MRSRLARPSRRLLHPLLGGIAWLAGLFVAVAVAASASHSQPWEQLAHMGLWPLGTLLVDEERADAVRRLVLERAAPVNASDDALATFAREGTSLAEWRERLRARMEQGGYRSTATTVDVAAAVLRSSRATPEQRVGAAVALRIAGEPPEKIRVAADAVADDRLRDALEAVAEDAGDARVEKALRASK